MRAYLLAMCLGILPTMVWSAPNLLLAKEYKNQDVKGWAMSEKLDGVRAYWDGKQLISRQGNVLTPPAPFVRHFPTFPLDGELFIGRGKFEQTSAIIRSKQGDWSQIKLHVFDAPSFSGSLKTRLDKVRAHLQRHPRANLMVIEQHTVRDAAHIQQFLHHVEQLGGEGVMLRHPTLPYEGGRSSQLLKVKSAHDAECVVTAHHTGKGRNSERMGAISCQNEKGEFRIGSGFSDAQRDHPPPIGSTVTYKYRGFTQKGTPRFATFVRIRQ